jgi:hypothetical protein
MGQNRDNKKSFNILKDGFWRQHKENKEIKKEDYHVFCDTCLTEQNHNEFNRYYSFAEHLIICFFRGKNYENNKNIEVEEKLVFPGNKKIPESDKSYYKYYLVGSVNRVLNQGKEEFFYFARDPKNKKHWFDSDGEGTLENAPINSIQGTGKIIILFYTAEK